MKLNINQQIVLWLGISLLLIVTMFITMIWIMRYNHIGGGMYRIPFAWIGLGILSVGAAAHAYTLTKENINT